MGLSENFFYLGIFDSNTTTTYNVKIPENGVYLFLIEGETEVNNKILNARDAMGITDFDPFEIKIKTKSKNTFGGSVNKSQINYMEAAITMEIKDNTFARQFETITEEGLVSVEYSFQEKKIFLTKINVPESFDDEEFISNFLKNILEIAIERKFKVVPILPKIVVFFKKNPVYKELLPPGIRL